MKDHSTMTTLEFLLSIVWKYVIGFIWYKNLLFRVLPHRDVYDSLQLLLIMMLVSVACFIIIMNQRKNGWTATACFVLPFGIYTMLTYSTTSALFIRVVAVASILLSLVYSILLFTRKIKQRGKIARRKVLQSRLSRCMYSVSCIMAVGMLFLMVGTWMERLFWHGVCNFVGRGRSAASGYQRRGYHGSKYEYRSETPASRMGGLEYSRTYRCSSDSLQY